MRHASIVTVLITLCVTSITHAQKPTDIAGKWRLHGETMLLLNHHSQSQVRGEWRNEATNAPLPSGFGAPTVGLGVGYALFDCLVVGVNLAGGSDRVTRTLDRGYETTTSAFTLDAAPYVELMTTGDVWRPFLAVTLHSRNESYTTTTSGLGGYQIQMIGPRGSVPLASEPNAGAPPAARFIQLTEDRVSWGGGLTAGLRAFVSNAVSLDASVRLVLWSESESLSVHIGLSGWL